MNDPKCQHCGAEMEWSKVAKKDMTAQLLGVFLFIIAVALLFMFPIGTIAGLVLMVVSARLGYKRVSGWKCPSCGYFFEVSD